MITVAIIACLKQEELYIREWLDWHIKCGVDHFYLCDNNDIDYEPKLKDVISDYIDKGIVEIFEYHNIHPIQQICYTETYHYHGDKYNWYLIIDIDEFICLPKYDDQLKEYLKTVPEQINCIGINWRYYGDNGLIEYENKPVQERFIMPIKKYCTDGRVFIYEGQSRIVKSILRGKQYFNYNIKKIHYHCAIQYIRSEYFYDVLFNRISKLSFNNISVPELKNINSKYFTNLYNTFYIKHYVTKTIDEYVFNKINRGDTISNKNEENYPYNLRKFFAFNEKTPEKYEFIKNKYNII